MEVSNPVFEVSDDQSYPTKPPVYDNIVGRTAGRNFGGVVADSYNIPRPVKTKKSFKCILVLTYMASHHCEFLSHSGSRWCRVLLSPKS